MIDIDDQEFDGPAATANALYPFRKMKVGQSFTVGLEDRKSVQSAAWQIGKATGMKFSGRTVGPDQYRTWRIK